MGEFRLLVVTLKIGELKTTQINLKFEATYRSLQFWLGLKTIGYEMIHLIPAVSDRPGVQMNFANEIKNLNL
jgi:hypothetical protein